MSELKKVIRDSIIVVVVCTIIAIFVNAIRGNGIPLIEKRVYEIFVPCPEPVGEVKRMAPHELNNLSKKAIIIDARNNWDYSEGHYSGAINIPFDYLEPVCAVNLKKIVSSGARMVIVYGDGLDPDSGKELARELSGNGIKNVYYVGGGAAFLLKIED